jgi:hypothetical protein
MNDATFDLTLSPTESPINKMEPTAGAAGSAAAIGNVSYHGAFSEKSPRNSQPVLVTDPAVPEITTDVV